MHNAWRQSNACAPGMLVSCGFYSIIVWLRLVYPQFHRDLGCRLDQCTLCLPFPSFLLCVLRVTDLNLCHSCACSLAVPERPERLTCRGEVLRPRRQHCARQRHPPAIVPSVARGTTDPHPSPLSLSARRTHFLLFATTADYHTGL